MLSRDSSAVGRVDSSGTLIGCVLAMAILIGGALSESARCVGGTEVTTVNKRCPSLSYSKNGIQNKKRSKAIY